MILLFFACATKSITGSVVNQQGEPLSQASVTFQEVETSTDSSGKYVIESLDLKKGTYTITVRQEGYVFQQQNIDVSGKTVLLPNITLAPISETIPYLPINLDPGTEQQSNEK